MAVDIRGFKPMDVRTQSRLPLRRLPVFIVLMAQLGVLTLVSAVLLIWQGWNSAYSGFLGGLIAWLPNLYFAQKAFRYRGARAARDILKSFYAGEAGKFVLTAVLFALVFAGVKPLDARSVFLVFIVTQMVSWFSPLLIKAKPLRP
jgi:ATP synthase protein I